MNNDMDKRHFGDKVRTCSKCGKKVLIKFNQVGGFWHLYNCCGYTGGVCPECYDKIKGGVKFDTK